MTPIIIGNWKMNPATLKEAKELLDSLRKEIKNSKKSEIIICPPFVYFSVFKKPFLNFKLGSQNCFWEEKGAFTGEISSKQLSDLGCQYVILGHSERRKYLNETDEIINKKIKAVLSVKLKPILCVGETEKEKKKGKTFEVIKKQIKKALNQLPNQSLRNIIIAYEPVWAIGTGKACGVQEAKIVNSFIKKIIKNTPILYGGSVNGKNAADFIRKANFQGFILGGASLNPKEFLEIIKIAGSS